MTQLALGMVLLSAVFHATWNLFSKRADGGLPFVWLFSALMTLFYAPAAIGTLLLTDFTLTPLALLFMFGTGLLHIAYFLMLTKGYEAGDLSIIYPLARGSGPMLATVAAIILFDERPSPLAIFGLISIAVGVFLFTGGTSIFTKPDLRRSIIYALIVGVTIATYTIWDKYAVSVILIPPLLYEWVSDTVRTILLTPMIRNRWSEVKAEWQNHRLEAIGVAILSPLAYLLILAALKFSPVSYIAPFREISILFGAIMGTYFLGEGNIKQRWSAASVILLGVIALAIG